jgi:hypothetical protein
MGDAGVQSTVGNEVLECVRLAFVMAGLAAFAEASAAE